MGDSSPGGNIGVNSNSVGTKCKIGIWGDTILHNQSYMYAVVFNGTHTKGYLNGVLACSVAGVPDYSSAILTGFGCQGGNTEAGMIVGESAYWNNTALSGINISNIYDTYMFGDNYLLYSDSNIIPSQPYVNDTLNASALFISGTIDEFFVDFNWSKDGELNYTFDTTITCEESVICYTDTLVTNLSYGENWTLSVRAYNGTEGIETDLYNISVIINQYSPIVSNVTIYPLRPYVADALNCSFVVTDQSPEPETITSNIIWFKNGVLNNTFNVSKETNLNQITYTDTLVTPLTEGDNWTCSVQAFDGILYSDYANSSAKGIYELLFDNCTDLSDKTLIFSIYNEETPTMFLNATLELELNYKYDNNSKNGTAYLYYSGASNYSLCYKPKGDVVQSDIYFRYTTDGGFLHRYYLYNYTLSNATKTLSLYNFNTTELTSQLKIYARDSTTYSPFVGLIGQLQRRYTSEGIWRTIQMSLVDDFGLLYYNIKEADTDYRLIFSDSNNNIYQTTNTLKFICTSGICEITYLINPLSISLITTNVTTTYEFNNNTNMVYFNWSDSTGLTSSGRLLVTKETMTGTATICDVTQTGNAGSMSCNLTGYTGTFLVKFLSSASPEESKFSEWLTIQAQQLFDMVGKTEASFWSLALVVTIALVGSLFGAVGGIMGVIIAFIFISFLGIINLINITAIIIVASMGILISTLIREK